MKRRHACRDAKKVVNYSDQRCDYFVLYARDLPSEQKFDEATYRNVQLYLINQRVPKAKKVEIEGIVVDDSQRNLTILVYDVSPPEENIENPTFTDEDCKLFQQHFSNNKNLVEAIDKSIQPKIVDRKDAKLAAALTLHSPLYLSFEGELIRGSLHTMFVGDTTTGKTEILRWIRDVLRLGEWGVGETSTRGGILFAVEPKTDIIIWGLLPLADKGVALIDGLQGINPLEISHFRDALREQKVTVRMKVSGEASCRTRILAAANPKKVLDAYVDFAEALLDIRCIVDPVDLARWDLPIRFYAKDVEVSKIAKSQYQDPAIPVEVFRKHVLWAWSLKPGQIIFKKEAIEAIRKGFMDLNELAYSNLPLIHKGYKETLARVAASFAILHHSSPDHQRVIVTDDHVNEATSFINDIIEAWQYELYAARMQRWEKLTDDEFLEMNMALNKDLTLRQVFEKICNTPGIQSLVLAKN